MASLLQLLMRHVQIVENGCWLWTGAKDTAGYGRVNKATYEESLAHRAVYLCVKGSINPNLHLCHHCDTPACVNPEHMFQGTNAENMSDAKRKKRRLGEKRKISDELIQAALQAVRNGRSQREVARQFQISESYLSQIKTGTRR